MEASALVYSESGVCAVRRDGEPIGEDAGSEVVLTATSVLTGSGQKHILEAGAATVKGIRQSLV